MTTAPTATAEQSAESSLDADERDARRGLAGYVAMPVFLAAVVAALVTWLHVRGLRPSEKRLLQPGALASDTLRHLELAAVSTVAVLAIALPLGILLTRQFARAITPPAISTFNIGQAVPSIGLIALFAIVWDIGFWPVVAALVAYTVLPVLRNTMVGLRQVDHSIIESARGMGMTKTAVLFRIELPLVVPIIMAGLRTALTLCVGTATLGAFVGAGGLGLQIVAGIVQNRPVITITGAVLVAVLALLIDYLAGIAEDLLHPKGL